MPAERGSILGPMLAATNLGLCFGPLIGGGIMLATKNSKWCFWSIFIYGASALILVGFTVAETARKVVGNGSIKPVNIWRT